MSDPYNTPGLSPPPGVVPMLGAPAPLLPTVRAISVVSLLIIFIAVALKLYAKIGILKEVHWDDHLIVVALVGQTVWTALFNICCTHGLAQHQWNVRESELAFIFNYLNIIETVYGILMGSAKMSVLLQIRRLFLTSRDSAIFWAVNFIGFVIVGYYVSCFFTFVFQCVPRAGIWNHDIGARCIDPKSATLSAGIVNFLTDLMLLTLPVWAVWHLHLPVRRKLAIASVFATGIFACVMGLAGTLYRIPLVDSPDFTHAIGIVGIWSMAEVAAVIIVGCMPSMPLLYRTIRNSSRRAAPLSSPSLQRLSPSGRPLPFSPAAADEDKAASHSRGRKLDSNAKYMGRARFSVTMQDNEDEQALRTVECVENVAEARSSRDMEKLAGQPSHVEEIPGTGTGNTSPTSP